MGWTENYLVGLLASFYHNSADVNKKIRGALGGDFDNRSGSDYGSDCSMRIGIYRFKYSQITGPPSLCRNLTFWMGISMPRYL